MSREIHIGRRLSPRPHWSTEPDWLQASEARIAQAVRRSQERPSGGWLVVDASRAIAATPKKYIIEGRELVAWRARGHAHVAPAACPHMGADLSKGCVTADRLVCPWHGLSLGPEGHGNWAPMPTYDDGVLVWVRSETREGSTEAPILPARPDHFLDAVIRMEARCEPVDIIANRFDPWHGVHYHPHSFSSLHVLDVTAEAMTLRVTYRIGGPFRMEVDACFESPEPNTIVMTIVGGEGTGSVVETHATRIGPGRTAVIEATLATSERPAFDSAIRAARLLRPFIEQRATRLWNDDIAYAERRYALRQQEPPRGALEPKAKRPLPQDIS